jgi:hypothetical protein
MWLLWAALSATMLGAAYALAVRATLGVSAPTATFERAAITAAGWFGLVVCATWAAGALHLLSPGPLAAAAVFVAATACGVAGAAALRAVPRTLVDDLRAAADCWRALFRESAPLLSLVAGATALWALTWIPVLLFRTWNYDATVYHAPLAHLFVQNGSTARLDTPSIWMQGYPYAGSLVAVWNIIFPKDTLLDDAGQMPTAVFLVSVTAAWLTRLQVKAHHALAFGCVALFLPTVFLQLGHGQVDLWCAGLLTLAVYALVFRGDRAGLLIFFACMALYGATKLSGLLHLALAFPLFSWSVWTKHRGRGWALAHDLGWGALLVATLGLTRYVENALCTKSPVYPFSLRIPFGPVLEGATEAHQHFGGYQGYSGALFTSPSAIPSIFGSWYHLTPAFWPDVRTGGFGWVFAFLLVPASAVVWLVWARKKQWVTLLPLVWLALMALSMPTPWWGRYTIPAALVGLVCAGWGFANLPRFQKAAAWALALVSFAGLFFAAAQLWRHRDFYEWPGHLSEAWAASGPERAAVPVVGWLWTREASRLREALPEGALVIHDEAADFFSEYFPRRLQTRVEYLTSTRPAAFADAVYARRAALVAVRKDSLAEGELKRRGAKFVAPTPRCSAHLYTLQP